MVEFLGLFAFGALVAIILAALIAAGVLFATRGLATYKPEAELEKSLTSIIDSIRNLPYEVQYFVRQDGKIIYSTTQYSPKRVTPPPERLSYLREHPGAIGVHNHNDDVPPSMNDLVFAADMKMSRTIVVSPHYVYTVLPPADGWKNQDAVNVAIQKHLRLFKATKKGQTAVALGGGIAVYDDIELETTEAAMVAVAQELGYTYIREKSNTSKEESKCPQNP